MARLRSEATIVFVAYAGEEQGLYGSTHFAELAKQNGWNIQGVLNMDIIGSPNGGNGVRDPRTIRLFSEGVPTSETPAETARRQSIGGENDGVSRQLARYVKETGENGATGMSVKLVWRRDRFLRGGDQIPFLERGWPAVRFTEPNENYDHQHQDVRVEDGRQFGDLVEFVDFGYLARVTRVVGSSLAALARAPRAPANARVIAAALSYDTELRWNANPEPDVVGYEIVWRDSTAPLWTDARRFGNVTAAHDPEAQQGRLPGRRARDRPRRQPQPGRLPDPRAGVGACVVVRTGARRSGGVGSMAGCDQQWPRSTRDGASTFPRRPGRTQLRRARAIPCRPRPPPRTRCSGSSGRTGTPRWPACSSASRRAGPRRRRRHPPRCACAATRSTCCATGSWGRARAACGRCSTGSSSR